MYVCRLVSTCHCLWITPQARCSASSRTLCSLGSCWGSEGTRNKTRTSWSDVRSNSNLQRCCDRGWVCMYVCVCVHARVHLPHSSWQPSAFLNVFSQRTVDKSRTAAAVLSWYLCFSSCVVIWRHDGSKHIWLTQVFILSETNCWLFW